MRRRAPRTRRARLGDSYRHPSARELLHQQQAFATAAANRVLIATRMAGRAYKRGDCLRAGQLIDQAYLALGEGKAYLHTVGIDVHNRLHDANVKLLSVDRLFERTCVLEKPKR